MSPGPLFGHQAMRMGLVQAEQVLRALDHQKDLEALGIKKRIGRILVEQGFMKFGDIDRVLDATGVSAEKRRDPMEDSQLDARVSMLLGDLVLATELLSREKLDECLAIQEKMRGMGMTPKLGQILIDKGYCEPGTLEALLDIQDAQRGDQPAPDGEPDTAELRLLDLDPGLGGDIDSVRLRFAEFHREWKKAPDEVGGVLVEQGVLSQGELDRVLAEQKILAGLGMEKRVADLLVEKKIVSQSVVAATSILQAAQKKRRDELQAARARTRRVWLAATAASVAALVVASLAIGQWALRRPSRETKPSDLPAALEESPRHREPIRPDEFARAMEARGLVRVGDRWLSPEARLQAAGDADARRMLARGMVRHEGAWIDREELAQKLALEDAESRGFVRVGDQWLTREEDQRRRERKEAIFEANPEASVAGGGAQERAPVDVSQGMPLEVRHTVEGAHESIEVWARTNLPEGALVAIEIAPAEEARVVLGGSRRIPVESGAFYSELADFGGPLFPGEYVVRAIFDPTWQPGALLEESADDPPVYKSEARIRVGTPDEALEARIEELDRLRAAAATLRFLAAQAAESDAAIANLSEATLLEASAEAAEPLATSGGRYAFVPFGRARGAMLSSIGEIAWLRGQVPRASLPFDRLLAGLDEGAVLLEGEAFGLDLDSLEAERRALERLVEWCRGRPLPQVDSAAVEPGEELERLDQARPLVERLLESRRTALPALDLASTDLRRWKSASGPWILELLRIGRSLDRHSITGSLGKDVANVRAMSSEIESQAGLWLGGGPAPAPEEFSSLAREIDLASFLELDRERLRGLFGELEGTADIRAWTGGGDLVALATRISTRPRSDLRDRLVLAAAAIMEYQDAREREARGESTSGEAGELRKRAFGLLE